MSSCNNFQCKRDKASLDFRRRMGWRFYYELKDTFIQSAISNNAVETVKDVLSKMIQKFDNSSEDKQCLICKDILTTGNVCVLKCGCFNYHETCLNAWKSTGGNTPSKLCSVCRDSRPDNEIFCVLEFN